MTTLVEDWRPKDWDGVYGNDWIKEVLQRMIKNDSAQHMLFVGRPGCGKTTMARIFASKYLGEEVDFSVDHPDYRELNASDQRGIDVVRGRTIKKFCQTSSETPGKKRILFLDEADSLTRDAQRAMRAVMENNQERVIIIMSMNHLESITEKALLSRVAVFKFEPQPAEKLKGYFMKIANGEGIEFKSDEIVSDILNFAEYEGDFRRVVNDTLQKLLGIDHPVGKEDLEWIYRENYQEIIRKIVDNPHKAKSTFFNYYRNNHVDPSIFAHQLFEELSNSRNVPYELSKIFAETEYRTKNGGDELIQLSYLLAGVENLGSYGN